MLENITPENTEVIELSADQKLQLENVQLKIRICELTQALASTEAHIYKSELEALLAEK